MDLLMVAQPTGLWESILFGIESGVGNYAVTIILITLMIKLVLLPLDFGNKLVTKRNSIKQAEMAPEMEKIKKRYGNNKELLNKKTMELYKSKNYSIGGMCGMMLGYMAVTMLVFFTLLGSLNNVSYYKMYTEYESVRTVYDTAYTETIEAGQIGEGYETIEAYADKVAGDKTVAEYANIKTGFLWIKNIWRPDTSNSPIMKYKDFANNVSKLKLKGLEVPEEAEYNKVMGALMKSEEYSGWNGYYILCIIAAVSTFASLYINTLISKHKKKKIALDPTMQATETSNKTMMIIMPIIMGVFTLAYTASFGIYIVTGSLFGLASNATTGVLVDKIVDKKIAKEKQLTRNSYDRKN